MLARAAHVGGPVARRAMASGAPIDLANELRGAGELLRSLVDDGEDRDAQLRKLFVSFNNRVSKLPHGIPENVVDMINAAIVSGPWTDRMKEALLALTDTVTRAPQRAEGKPFQHALRRTTYEPHSHAMHARALLALLCYSIRMLSYARGLCSRRRFEAYITQEEWAKLRRKPVVPAACGIQQVLPHAPRAKHPASRRSGQCSRVTM